MAGRSSTVLGICVAVVVVATIAAAVVSAQRGTADLDPSSPPGVVQQYLAALAAGDVTAAAALLADDSPCTMQDLAAAYTPTSLRAVLTDTDRTGTDRTGTDQTGTMAVVGVDITENADQGLFGDGGWTHSERIVLVLEHGDWRITDVPWPLYSCGVEKSS